MSTTFGKTLLTATVLAAFGLAGAATATADPATELRPTAGTSVIALDDDWDDRFEAFDDDWDDDDWDDDGDDWDDDGDDWDDD